jgi:DNA-binding beta-propeller fold protein YncE
MPRASIVRTSALTACPLVLSLLAGCKSGGDMNTSKPLPPALPGEVAGRYIMTISDADLTAPALQTGRLGERDPAARDTLTVLELPIREPATPWAQMEVSNSVIGPPNALSVSPDGNTAFVIETRGPAPEGAVTINDLPAGQKLFAIDMTNPVEPRILGTADVGANPMAVDAHPAGDIVAVVTSVPHEQIVIVPVGGGAVGEPLAWSLIGVDDSSAIPSCITWSPDGRLLAITIPEQDRVVFLEFTRDANDGSMGLRPWGQAVNVGKYPYSGKFSPDGRYFITTDLQWGRDVEEFRVGAPEGRLSVVEVVPLPPPDEKLAKQPEHRVVSTAVVGVSPEGLAISPDGGHVVTANLRQSYLDDADPRLTRGGSLTLLTLDAAGQLSPIGEFELDGMPEGLAFDASGNFVVVTQFRSFDPSAPDGELAFFRLNRGARPNATLEPTDFRVGVGKGPHGVLIVR